MEIPEVGQKVMVPWGLDVLPGTVVRTYDSGSGTRVVVRVEVPGVSLGDIEDVTATLPLDALVAAQGSAGQASPGQWVHGQAYEREVLAHIGLMLRRIEFERGINLSINRQSADYRGVDFLVTSSDNKVIAGEIKYFTRRQSISLSVIGDLLLRMERGKVPLILISNTSLSRAAADNLRQTDTHGRFHWILWRGERDNDALERTIISLLSDAW